MHPCGFADPCFQAATVSVRLAGIGDRHVCQAHYEWMVQQGMDLRVLDPHSPVPEWRKRSLARDFTGRVLTA